MTKKGSKIFVGCNCIKSKCTKNYCECFTQGTNILKKEENVSISANAPIAKTEDSHKKNIDRHSKFNKHRDFATAKNQTASKNTANASTAVSSALPTANVRNAKMEWKMLLISNNVLLF